MLSKGIGIFYFVDEQFSYVNSDLEIACLVTMVNLLDDGEQLFTTHDTEILSLRYSNLPMPYIIISYFIYDFPCFIV